MASGLEFLNLDSWKLRALEGIAKLGEQGTVIIKATADATAQQVRDLAPVGTGEEDVPGQLRDSIEVVDGSDGTGPFVAITATAPYAAYVEFGTSKMPAEPFFRPALAVAKLSEVV